MQLRSRMRPPRISYQGAPRREYSARAPMDAIEAKQRVEFDSHGVRETAALRIARASAHEIVAQRQGIFDQVRNARGFESAPENVPTESRTNPSHKVAYQLVIGLSARVRQNNF